MMLHYSSRASTTENRFLVEEMSCRAKTIIPPVGGRTDRLGDSSHCQPSLVTKYHAIDTSSSSTTLLVMIDSVDLDDQ